MKTFSFAPGADFCVDGSPCRAVRHLPGDVVLVEELATGKILQFTINELLDFFESGKVTAFEDDDDRRGQRSLDADLAVVPELYRAVALQRRDVVERTLEVLDGKVTLKRVTLNFEHIMKPVKRCAGGFLHSEPTPRQVYDWSRRYLRQARSINAFVPRISGRGHRAPRLDSRVFSIMSKVVEDFYLTRKKNTIVATQREVTRRVDIWNDDHHDDAPLAAPSLQCIYRFVGRLSPFDVVVAREGPEAAHQRFRGGAAGAMPTRPLERAEVDHNRMDVRAVDGEGSVILGRPWLTVILDCYSRMVLGYYLSFEDPSSVSVNQALLCAINSKVGLLKRMPDVTHAWPCYGLPQTLVVDNGMDLHSSSFRDACAELRIAIDYTPPKRPQNKGRIERFFGTMNTGVVHLLPGTTRSNPEDRGEISSVNRPTLSLQEIEATFVKWVVDVYHQQFHSGINARPIDLWMNRS